MENINRFWPEEKANKQLKIASWIIIITGVIGLIMAGDDFISLGRRVSAFIIPYLYNIIAIFVSIFQICTGIAFGKKRLWAKNAIYWIVIARFVFCYFDYAEVWQAGFLLIYLFYAMKPARLGSLFKEKGIFG